MVSLFCYVLILYWDCLYLLQKIETRALFWKFFKRCVCNVRVEWGTRSYSTRSGSNAMKFREHRKSYKLYTRQHSPFTISRNYCIFTKREGSNWEWKQKFFILWIYFSFLGTRGWNVVRAIRPITSDLWRHVTGVRLSHLVGEFLGGLF